MALLASHLLRLTLLLPLPQPSTSLLILLLRTAHTTPLRPSAPKKARLAKGRPASWRSLADQYPPPRTRTDGHACARCGPLSFSFFPFPFRYRFPILLAFPRSSFLSFIHLSFSYRLLTSYSFSFSPASLRPFFPDSPSSFVLFLSAASPLLSLRLSRALDFSPASLSPSLDFSSPLRPSTILLLFALLHRLGSSLPSLLFLLPRRSVLLPPLSLHTPPRRLRRDGPIFSSRFLGSDIFLHLFSPPSSGCPCAAPPPSEYRLEHPLRLPLPRVAHTHMISFFLASSILRPFSLPVRSHLSLFPPLFHFSLPFTPASLSPTLLSV